MGDKHTTDVRESDEDDQQSNTQNENRTTEKKMVNRITMK